MTMTPSTPEAYQLLHDGSLALSIIEGHGMRIDIEYLNATIEATDNKIKRVEAKLKATKFFKRWEDKFGIKTKLGNRKQMGAVLQDMGIKGREVEKPWQRDQKKAEERDANEETKYSFDAEALGQINNVPFLRGYIKLEKLKKIRGTYLKGFQKEIQEGYLHCGFSLHTVRTFRSSSSGPNFQNIPVRDPEYAKLLRTMFIPRKNHKLIEMDFGQLEVRIAACYNKDPTLIDYIISDRDMHRDMAARCFMVKRKQVTKNARYAAKNKFVFPAFYGSMYTDMAKSLWNGIDELKLDVDGMPMKKHLDNKGIYKMGDCNIRESAEPGSFEKHIKNVDRRFWEEDFPIYNAWKENWWKTYQQKMSFSMLTGFQIDGVYKRNDVINYPIQGAAFHCLLWSLIRLVKLLRKYKMKTKVIGQIHDSILADVHKSEVQQYLDLAYQILTVDLPKAWEWIIVPLDAEAEVAEDNWYGKREWVKSNGIWGAAV